MATINPILDKAAKAVPAAPTSSVSAITDALNISEKRINTSISSALTGVKDTNTQTHVIVQAINDISTAKAISANAADLATLQQQKATSAVIKAGLTQGQQINLQKDLTGTELKINDLFKTREKLYARTYTGIKVIDSMINDVRSVDNTNAIKTGWQKEKQLTNAIHNLTVADESFARMNALAKQSVTEASVKAHSDQIVAEGKKQAAAAELAAIHNNSVALNAVMAADGKKVNNLLEKFRLEGAVQQREIQTERLAAAKQQLAFQTEKFKVQLPTLEANLKLTLLNLDEAKRLHPTRVKALEDKYIEVSRSLAEAKGARDAFVTNVQKAQEAAGVPHSSADEISYGITHTRDKSVIAKLTRLNEIGADPNLVMGRDPFEASQAYKLVAPSGNYKETRATKFLAEVAKEQTDKYAQDPAAAPKSINSPVIKADFNKLADNLLAVKASDIKTNDQSNIFSAPPMSVLAQHASVVNTPLYQKVLKAKGFEETDPKKLIDAAIVGVLSKSITPEQAADGIGAIFKAAVAYNNTSQGGPQRAGLGPQTSYYVVLQRKATFIDALAGNSLANKAAFSFLSPTQGSVVTKAVVATAAIGSDVRKALFSGDIGERINLINHAQVQRFIIKGLSSSPVQENK